MQAPDAAIMRIIPPFHEAVLFQLVDQAGGGDRFNFQQFGQFFLRQAGLAFDPHQGDPLCPRHAVRRRAAICFQPQMPRQVVQQE